MFRFADLLVLLAVAVALVALAVGTSLKAGESSNRVKCASNLRQVGLAFILYADDEPDGSFPRTAFDPAAPGPFVAGTPYDDHPDLPPRPDVSPFLTPDLPADLAAHVPDGSDVSTPLFLLLRTQDISPGVFTCPSSNATTWHYAGRDEQHFTNFPGRRGVADHLSYSSLNPYPAPSATPYGYDDRMPAARVLAADMNPGTLASLAATPAQPRLANSANHAGHGQNVLHADGHVTWETTPFLGPAGDSIYSVAGARDPADLTLDPPADAADVVLLPTAEMVGQPTRYTSATTPRLLVGVLPWVALAVFLLLAAAWPLLEAARRSA